MLTAKRLRKVLSYTLQLEYFGGRRVLAAALLVALWPAQKMGGATIKFALVVGLIRQVALLGSI